MISFSKISGICQIIRKNLGIISPCDVITLRVCRQYYSHFVGLEPSVYILMRVIDIASRKPLCPLLIKSLLFCSWIKVSFLLNRTKYPIMDQVNLLKTAFKKLKWYGLLRQNIPPQIFLKAVFQKFYLVHSLILCLKYSTIKLRGLFKTLSNI